jgi:hypothetical protein
MQYAGGLTKCAGDHGSEDLWFDDDERSGSR